MPRALAAILALSLALGSVGAGWGLPNDRSWSNDDPTPRVPLRIGQIWCCGHDRYPYLQPLITRAVYAPSLAWWRLRGEIAASCADLGDADCYARPYEQLGWLMRLSRALAAVMGAGVVAAVYAMAVRLYADRRAALCAALAAAVIHELVLFSHWGNVDVPYLFWFAWSIVAFLDVVQRGRTRDFAAFGLLAAAALATKESIVGAYVGVGLAILVVHARRALAARPPGQPAAQDLWRAALDQRLLILLACLLGLYGLANNVVFNPSGFAEHVGYWIGGAGIAPWNDRFSGHAALLATFGKQLGDAVGRPWLAAAGVAAALAAWRDRRTGWVLLPAASYYLFTIAPIRYAFTRFTLPVAILLAVPLGWLAARAMSTTLGRVALAMVFAHALLYSMHADVMLVIDSRYAAERWLASAVPRQARVVAIGSPSYLPRLAYLGYAPQRLDDDDASLPAILAEDADVVVMARRSRAAAADGASMLVDQLVGSGYTIAYEATIRAPLAPFIGTDFIETRVIPRAMILAREGVVALTPPPSPSAGAATPPPR